MTSSKQGSWCN